MSSIPLSTLSEGHLFFNKLVQFCSVKDALSVPGSYGSNYLNRVKALSAESIQFCELLQKALGLDTKVSYTADPEVNGAAIKKIINLIAPFIGSVEEVLTNPDSHPYCFASFVSKDQMNDPEMQQLLAPVTIGSLIKSGKLQQGQTIFVDGKQTVAKYSTAGEFYDVEAIRIAHDAEIIDKNDPELRAFVHEDNHAFEADWDTVKRNESGLEDRIANDDAALKNEFEELNHVEAVDIHAIAERTSHDPVFAKFAMQFGDSKTLGKIENLSKKPEDTFKVEDIAFCSEISKELQLEISFLRDRLTGKPFTTEDNLSAAKQVLAILTSYIEDAREVYLYHFKKDAGQ